MFLAAAISLWAGDLDTIGVTVLRQVDPTLQGSGVRVAQPEGSLSTNLPPTFEVNPAATGQPENLFTYISGSGVATNYPNSAGINSSHADAVGENYYGISSGVATNVSHMDNYDADYFFTSIISPRNTIPARIVNQSFIFYISDELLANTNYDNYAAQYGTLFISGIGNGGGTPVSPPATCFNGIGVGVYGAPSSFGPTDDGRSKPDIAAPGGFTSFSTPYVAGSAAILLQAANRGDGGANTNAAGDLRVLKALLLNGAIKPNDWTNGVTSPLDARYGAGIVNAFNSWQQMKGGQYSFIESTSNTNGTAHPPGANTNNEPVLAGWDFNSIATTRAGSDNKEQVNHYYFNLPANGGNSFTLTTTLVWNRHFGRSNINDLNLFLYNAGNSNLVACSTSAVDNVEHIFLPALPPGRYDLQVQKNPAAQVSTNETYALAFEMFNLNLNVARKDGVVVITWPVYPTGFNLQSAANLDPPISWTAVNAPVAVNTSTYRNVVIQTVGGTNQFFRLQRP